MIQTPELSHPNRVTATRQQHVVLHGVRRGRPDGVGAPQSEYGRPGLDLLRKGTFEQLAAGLSALHTSGHLHRDIKPSNLLVQRDGRVVILDFGLATRVDQVDIRDIRGFSGTLEYMAPEQSEGRDPLPASDWYSFGCVLFQALTGQLPFRGRLSRSDERQQDGPRQARS